ncbi:MAG TPA: glycosyl hydrolase family 79 C-terminal domain-containing protein [Solirubrobacteraceae bacterium]|nr:glycosyl hydrolase family 79 C-terminal domain-containing protein [Solirubrobacteraceae bacterium]
MIGGQGSGRWWRWWRWALVATLVAGLAYAVTAAGDPGSASLFSPGRRARPAHAAARRWRSDPVQVTIAAQAPLAAVPPSFLGLSTAYWSLPHWASQMPLLERVLSLVHPRGTGRLILRIGGDSADHSFWDPQALPLERWAFSIQPRELRQIRQLVRTLRLRLILDLNLITGSPAQAAQWAQAADKALPKGSILAFEVGNEPDIYSRAAWLAVTGGRADLRRPLPGSLTARSYVSDFRAYARALRALGLPTMLAGPVIARPVAHVDWVRNLTAQAGGALGMVTIHRYPLAGCMRRASPLEATVGHLLSPRLAQGMAAALRPIIAAAHDAELPIRLTELNSVDCGGRPGVSNTFATALWAPGALFALARAGIDGVNVHIRAHTINAPFAITGAGLRARPLLYGLILFARALGPNAHLVRVGVHARRPLNLQVYAVRVGRDRLHVVLINKSSRPARVLLRLPATANARTQRLLAPTPAAESGVTLGGRWLGSDGRWRGTAVNSAVAPRAGTYTVDVRRTSAVLLTVPVTPGALGSPATGARRSRAGGRALPAARFPRR